MSIQSVPGLYFALYSKDCTFMLFENCKTSMPNRNQKHFGTKTIEPQHCCQDASRHRLQTACSTWPKRHPKGIKFNPSYRFHQISLPFSPFSLYEPTVQLPVYVGRMILGKNCARLPAGPVCFFLCRANGFTSLKVWIKKTCGAIGRRRRVPAACHKIMRAHATCRLSNHGGKAIFAGFGGSACQMSASSPWVNQKGRFSWLEGLKSFQLSLAKATGYNFIGISNFEMGFGKHFIRGGVDRHKSVVTCDHTNATPKRLEILYNVVVQGSHHVLDPNFQDASWFQTPSTQEIARCQFSNAPSTWKTTISCRLGYDTIPATKWFHSVPSSHLRP